MFLCGNPLPWVDSFKHLGNMVSNKVDGGQLDLKTKTAQYIDKNCTINQEFCYHHPITKFTLNKIYKCHFTGSQIWNISSEGAEKFYSSYNRSIKMMAGLPLATHRNLIEPLSGVKHMSSILIKNFWSFITKVKQSNKYVLRQMYEIAQSDVRTVTGSNLRNILLLTDMARVGDLKPSSIGQIR